MTSANLPIRRSDSAIALSDRLSSPQSVGLLFGSGGASVAASAAGLAFLCADSGDLGKWVVVAGGVAGVVALSWAADLHRRQP